MIPLKSSITYSTAAAIGYWVTRTTKPASSALSRLLRWILRLWFFSEVGYWVLFRFKLSAVQKFTQYPSFPLDQRRQTIDRILQTLKLASPSKTLKQGLEDFMRGWFLNAPMEQISYVQVCNLFSKNFFGIHFEQIGKTDPRNTEITDLVQTVAKHVKLSEENIHLAPKCPPRDPVIALYRPLVFYLIIFCFQQTASLIFNLKGFTSNYAGQLRYWHRPGDPSKPPLVFFHGVSPSILPYVRFILSLSERELFVVEQPWVAMNMFSHLQVPTSTEFAEDIDFMLGSHGFRKACFIGHSLGSFPCAFVVKNVPHIVQGLVLIDPPAILMFMPHSTMGFLHTLSYGRVNRGNLSWMAQFVLLANFYFSAREIGITSTMGRKLFWWECNLFVQDLPENCTVILSEKDTIVDVKSIQLYLERARELQMTPKDLHVHTQSGMPHGGFLLSTIKLNEAANLILQRH